MAEFIVICIIFFIIWKIIESARQPKQTKTFSPLIVPEIFESPFTKFIFQPTPHNIEFLKALVFMGKSDGALREPERLEIIAYLKRVQPEHEQVPDSYLQEEIKNLPLMRSKEYKQYIAGLDKKSVQSLLAWSKRVAETQKTIHPFAEYLLEELENKSNQAPADDYEVVGGIRTYRIS